MDNFIASGCKVRKTEILRNILLESSLPSAAFSSQDKSSENAQMNPIRPNLSSGILVSSGQQQPPNTISIPHGLVTHSIPAMKSQNTASYPLQLHLGGTTTVNVPVQLASSTANINVPVQLSATPGSVPLQLTAPVSLPANIPVQLPGGAAVNVPLKFPVSQNQMLPSMPMLQTSAAQPQFNSPIIHVQIGSNTSRPATSNEHNMETVFTTASHPTPVTSAAIQVSNNAMHVMSGSAPGSSMQLGGGGGVGVRSGLRMPQVVYINPATHKPTTSTTTPTNHKQIIVRRPANNSTGIQIVNPKGNLAPKLNIPKTTVIGSGNNQPILIQKPKINANIVPVSIATNAGSKQTFAYLGSVKKPSVNKIPENQSILLPNSQLNSTQSNVPSNNQKLFLTPMNMQKIQNTKYILPVNLPPTMAAKGPIINLQIANGQLQNDHQGNITVMKESVESDPPPLLPINKISNTINGKESIPVSKAEQSFTLSIPGSRAEPTGEQEYTLSIPDTNASMNDDIYTVSIEGENEGDADQKSFVLAIPEKGRSLVNKPSGEKIETSLVPAPAILRRSNSENIEKKIISPFKRRISLCSEKIPTKKNIMVTQTYYEESKDSKSDSDNNEEQVPSLFCDEKLEKDLETKVNPDDKQVDIFKEKNKILGKKKYLDYQELKKEYKPEVEIFKKEGPYRLKKERISMDSITEEDPPGLVWNNGVAQLHGSKIHFQTNEFGLIDVLEPSDQENNFLLNPSSKYQTPLKQRIGHSGREKKPTSPEDLYCCDGCGCHGMAADFITPNFCSLTCQQVYQKLAPQKKKERDKAELLKRRNKVKKLLSQQSQKLDSQSNDSQPGDSDSRLNPIAMKPEELLESKKYPWMCGSSGFSWTRYLEHCKAKSAPTKLFPRDGFPYNCKNGFKTGMKLEAIDPAHAAIFCVVTIVETQGFRMRLHFDSYPDLYNFWVNADSIDIFPPGWCERNNRVLKPPQGYTTTSFNWNQYLKQCKAVGAPRHLFTHLTQGGLKPNGFRIGMKLEAEDRKNKLTCVASVSDILDNRILINFDSWDEKYDYWVDPTSPYIHPVGWAEENGHPLTPPNFCKDPENFTWENYLRETGSTAVPPRAFKPRPPHGFKVGMKMEVVDKRAPFLIRVGTVSSVSEHALRVAYDGWPDMVSVWLEDDSPDMHPVGWCLKTGHPLEPPLTTEEQNQQGPCGTRACRGLGSLRGGPHKMHTTAAQCPYKDERPPTPPDRLDSATFATHLLPKTRVYTQPKQKSVSKAEEASPEETQKDKNVKVRPAKHKRVEEVTKSDEQLYDEDSNSSSATSKRWRGGGDEAAVEATVLCGGGGGGAGGADGGGAGAGGWGVLCPDVALVLRQLPLPRDPRQWTQEDVRDFVESASVCSDVVGQFSKHRVTGPDLLMMSQEEMVGVMGLKLGPAIKIYASVLQLRKMLS